MVVLVMENSEDSLFVALPVLTFACLESPLLFRNFEPLLEGYCKLLFVVLFE